MAMNKGRLLSTLKGLSSEELKEFQWWLMEGVAGYPPIQKSELENAARQDTVDRIVSTYTLPDALKLTVEILREMHRNDLSQKLAADMERSTSSLPPQTASRGASSMGGVQTVHVQSESAEKQLRAARREFVKGVTEPVLNDLLDELLQAMVINDSESESVKVKPERAEKARALVDSVLRKGDQPCSVMIEALLELDHHLHSKLGFK